MATISSSQGFPSGILGTIPQTSGDLIQYSLENLIGNDFKKFKNKLSDFSYGDRPPIPRGKLENADWITTKDILIDTYGEEGALDVTSKVFTLISLIGPASNLQERTAQHAKLEKMIHASILTVFRKKHRESMKEIFQRIKEYNSRMGENVSLQKIYTKLSLSEGLQNKLEKEQEMRSSGRKHKQNREKRSSDESSTTIQTLFDPDKDGFTPKIVVLQGPAGIGKTMTSKKIMLDWASENLYQDRFEFVFYLSCREISTITGKINLEGLLSRTCRLQCSNDLVSLLKDPESQKNLLFIVDGFDELKWTLEKESEGCFDIFEETDKEILLQRLLRKQILQQSSLIITTRSLAMKKLDTFIDDSRYVEVRGFTKKDRKEYVYKSFANKEDADKVFKIIKDNEILYKMCKVPVTCWILCTVMRQEIQKDLGFIRCKTETSIYLLYLEVLITHHRKKDQNRNPQALQTCLKKLCALANEGVLKQMILFEEEDLQRHGLSLSEVDSVFLNENIFHWDVRTQTCYSFIHLSVQEFFAALYYVLDDDSGDGKKTLEKRDHTAPEIFKGKSLSCFFFSEHPHLGLTVKFLYGLINEKEIMAFSDSTGIRISFRVKSTIEKWAMDDSDKGFPIRAIACLYETQDEDFIRRIMSCRSHLKINGSYACHKWTDNSYSTQLGYCLKTLKNESFQAIYFVLLTVDPECKEILSSLLQRCQIVWFKECKFPSPSGADNRRDEMQNFRPSLLQWVGYSLYNKFYDESFVREYAVEYEGEFSSGDKMEPANISFLNQDSTVQKLSLILCDLTPLNCDQLYFVLLTNPSLTRLDISENNLKDSGIKRLCRGLIHYKCVLQELRVCYCNATLACYKDLCSVITKNKILTTLEITLHRDEKMSNSEADHCCEALQKAGFTVDRDKDGERQILITYRRKNQSCTMS